MKVISDWAKCTRCNVEYDDSLWTKKCPCCGHHDHIGYGAKLFGNSDAIDASAESRSQDYHEEVGF